MLYNLRTRIPYAILPVVVLTSVVLSLQVTNRLQYYIHPRYITFTTIFAFLALLMSLIYAFVYHPSPHKHKSSITPAQAIMYIVCAFALFIPATSISSDLAVTRSSPSVGSSPQASLYDSFSTDFSHFTIQDWASTFASKSVSQHLNGKTTSITGFLLSSEETYRLARFQLTCCAVDATPITVEIRDEQNRLQDLSDGTWLIIAGTSVINENEQYIAVENVEVVDEPSDPYIY